MLVEYLGWLCWTYEQIGFTIALSEQNMFARRDLLYWKGEFCVAEVLDVRKGGSSEVRQAGKIRKHSDLNPAVTSFHSLTPLTRSVTSDDRYYLHLSFLNSFLNALPFPLLKCRNSSFFPRHEWIKKSVNNSLSHLYVSVANFHVQIFLGGIKLYFFLSG